MKDDGYRWGYVCNICRGEWSPEFRKEGVYHCALCEYDVCPDCYKERDLGKVQRFLNRVPKRLGKFLRVVLQLSWALHLHLFLCCVFPCIIGVGSFVISARDNCVHVMIALAI